MNSSYEKRMLAAFCVFNELKKKTQEKDNVILYVLFYTNGCFIKALSVLRGRTDLLWTADEDRSIISEDKDQIQKMADRRGKKSLLERISFLESMKKDPTDKSF